MTNQDPYVWRNPWEEIDQCERALNTAIKGWPKTMRQRDQLSKLVDDYRDGFVRAVMLSVVLLAALVMALFVIIAT